MVWVSLTSRGAHFFVWKVRRVYEWMNTHPLETLYLEICTCDTLSKSLRLDLWSSLQFSHSVMSNSLLHDGLQHPGPQSLFKFMSIESVMPSYHLILCHPLLLPLVSPSVRVLSNESVLCSMWPKYRSSCFSIILPMNIQDWFPLGLTGLISLQTKGLSRVFSSPPVWRHQFFSAQSFLLFSSYICTWLLEKP